MKGRYGNSIVRAKALENRFRKVDMYIFNILLLGVADLHLLQQPQ